MQKLNVESLGDRNVPSVVTQSAGVLTVVGDTNAPNVVTIDPGASAGQIRVNVNGTAAQYSGVNQVVVVGGNRADDISNNTSVNLTADGGRGDDTIFGGTGVNNLTGGQGRDVIYSLLGTTTVNAADDNQADRVYVGNGASVSADPNDQVVTFFAKGRVPGSGLVQLDGGVLYITPTNAGTTVSIDEVDKQIVVTYNFGNGPQVATFNKKDVNVIAYFGGSGNDTYVNNTKIEEAAYGAAGNDTLVGGFGDFNLLKGSGGNDTLIGRGKRVDASGNGGADVIVLGPKVNTVRTDALDVVVGDIGFNDLIVGS